jgi:hypothetical protein
MGMITTRLSANIGDGLAPAATKAPKMEKPTMIA